MGRAKDEIISKCIKIIPFIFIAINTHVTARWLYCSQIEAYAMGKKFINLSNDTSINPYAHNNIQKYLVDQSQFLQQEESNILLSILEFAFILVLWVFTYITILLDTERMTTRITINAISNQKQKKVELKNIHKNLIWRIWSRKCKIQFSKKIIEMPNYQEWLQFVMKELMKVDWPRLENLKILPTPLKDFQQVFSINFRLKQIQFPKLKICFIDSFKIRVEAMKYLAKGDWSLLEKLALWNCHLNEEAIRILIKYDWKNLETLSLNFNKLNDRTMKQFSLGTWPKLQTLAFQKNKYQDLKITEIGVIELAKKSHPQLKKVDLRGSLYKNGCQMELQSIYQIKI